MVLAPLHEPSQWGLLLTLGVLSAAGAGAGSFSILIGATAQHMPRREALDRRRRHQRRRLVRPVPVRAAGAGRDQRGRLGRGDVDAGRCRRWLTLPLAWPLRRRAGPMTAGAARHGRRPAIGLREQLRIALRDRSYWLLHVGFFTCGVHIAFLVTHLPGEIALCGLPASVSAISLALIGLFNVAGSLGAGWLGQRYRMKYLLGGDVRQPRGDDRDLPASRRRRR